MTPCSQRRTSTSRNSTRQGCAKSAPPKKCRRDHKDEQTGSFTSRQSALDPRTAIGRASLMVEPSPHGTSEKSAPHLLRAASKYSRRSVEADPPALVVLPDRAVTGAAQLLGELGQAAFRRRMRTSRADRARASGRPGACRVRQRSQAGNLAAPGLWRADCSPLWTRRATMSDRHRARSRFSLDQLAACSKLSQPWGTCSQSFFCRSIRPTRSKCLIVGMASGPLTRSDVP